MSNAAATRAFPLLGEPLPLDLVNTVVGRDGQLVDLLSDLDHLEGWLAAEGERLPRAPATPELLRSLRRLRTTVAACVSAASEGTLPDESHIDELTRVAGRAPTSMGLEAGPQGILQRRLERRGSPSVQVPAIVAESTIEFLTCQDAGELRERLRRCAGEGCVLTFYATHAARQWCSSRTCGNRSRVRRHYRRHHGG